MKTLPAHKYYGPQGDKKWRGERSEHHSLYPNKQSQIFRNKFGNVSLLPLLFLAASYNVHMSVRYVYVPKKIKFSAFKLAFWSCQCNHVLQCISGPRSHRVYMRNIFLLKTLCVILHNLMPVLVGRTVDSRYSRPRNTQHYCFIW